MLNVKKLQQIRDLILGVTVDPSKYGDLNSVVYLQQILDAVKGTDPLNINGNLAEHVYLQKIVNAKRGVTNTQYGNLPNSIYLQQLINAYTGAADGNYGSLPQDVYLDALIATNLLGGAAAGPSSLLTGLIAYWKMDEVQDANPPEVVRADSSGRGNNLSETGPTPSVDGKVGKAAHVTTTTHLTKASNDDMRTGDIDFELAGWVFIPTALDQTWIWGKHTSQYTSIEYALRINASKLDFIVRNGTNTGYGNVSWGTNASADTWYFVDVYHDAANNKLGISVNGGAFATADFSGGVYSFTNPLDFSHDSGGEECYLDEWGFWKRLLTPAERTTLYNGGSGTTHPFDGAAPAADPANGYVVGNSTSQVVFVGDSLTYGLYCSEREKYTRKTMDALSEQFPFTNLGQTQWDIADVVGDAATADALYDGDLVHNFLVVWIGINDMRVIAITPADAYDDLVAYCQARQAAGWEVVILTLTPASDTYMSAEQRAAYEARRVEFNGYIAGGYATFADALANVGADGTIGDSGDEANAVYYFDRLHLTPEGAKIAAGIVDTSLETLF